MHVSGIVISDRKEASSLGFPTANLGIVLPLPFGVYAARVTIAGVERQGAVCHGMIGKDGKPKCEVHVLDFFGDLYGQKIDLDILEEKVSVIAHGLSRQKLKEKIKKDIAKIIHKLKPSMFSGIVRHRATIVSTKELAGGRECTFRAERGAVFRLRKGDSVLLNGICLSVRKKGFTTFVVEIMPQSLRRTTAGSWKVGDCLNMEPSLCVGDQIGGHFILGHVDGVGEVVSRVREGNGTILTIRAPLETIRMMLPRASISLDGVSITVVNVKGDTFRVTLLEDTLTATTLGGTGIGTNLNIEIDMLSRYAFQYLSSIERSREEGGNRPSEV